MDKDPYQAYHCGISDPQAQKENFKEEKTNQITYKVLRIRMADLSTAIMKAKNNETGLQKSEEKLFAMLNYLPKLLIK